MPRRLAVPPIALLVAVAVSGCTAKSSANTALGTSAAVPTSALPTKSTSAAPSCTPASLKTKKAGTLTVATRSPAREPWFFGDNPANGKGFEAAVAYAVAKQLGYPSARVRWIHASLDSVIAPKPKNFDLDIGQVSITAARKKAVDFSTGYYDVAQAVVALKSDRFATAAGIDALHGARLGAHAGTTALDAVKKQIRPGPSAHEYPTTHLAVEALKRGQIDAVVVDLPTALHLTAGTLADSTIVGQLPVVGSPEKFGLVLAKGSPLTTCVSGAVTALQNDGTLTGLQTTWLTTAAGAAVLH